MKGFNKEKTKHKNLASDFVGYIHVDRENDSATNHQITVGDFVSYYAGGDGGITYGDLCKRCIKKDNKTPSQKGNWTGSKYDDAVKLLGSGIDTEKAHDYVQIFFPTESVSINGSSDFTPIVTQRGKLQEYLEQNPEQKKKVEENLGLAVEKMIEHLKLPASHKPGANGSINHNYLRITRILKTLVIFNHPQKDKLARQIYEEVRVNEAHRSGLADGVFDASVLQWKEAVFGGMINYSKYLAEIKKDKGPASAQADSGDQGIFNKIRGDSALRLLKEAEKGAKPGVTIAEREVVSAADRSKFLGQLMNLVDAMDRVSGGPKQADLNAVDDCITTLLKYDFQQVADIRLLNQMLLIAAKHKRLKLFKFAISKGADVNCADKDVNSVLHNCVMQADFATIRILADNGVNPLSPNAAGRNSISLFADRFLSGNVSAEDYINYSSIIKNLLKPHILQQEVQYWNGEGREVMQRYLTTLVASCEGIAIGEQGQLSLLKLRDYQEKGGNISLLDLMNMESLYGALSSPDIGGRIKNVKDFIEEREGFFNGNAESEVKYWNDEGKNLLRISLKGLVVALDGCEVGDDERKKILNLKAYLDDPGTNISKQNLEDVKLLSGLLDKGKIPIMGVRQLLESREEFLNVCVDLIGARASSSPFEPIGVGNSENEKLVFKELSASLKVDFGIEQGYAAKALSLDGRGRRKVGHRGAMAVAAAGVNPYKIDMERHPRYLNGGNIEKVLEVLIDHKDRYTQHNPHGIIVRPPTTKGGAAYIEKTQGNKLEDTDDYILSQGQQKAILQFINIGDNHWTLAYRFKEEGRSRLYYFDPLGGEIPPELLHNWKITDGSSRNLSTNVQHEAEKDGESIWSCGYQCVFMAYLLSSLDNPEKLYSAADDVAFGARRQNIVRITQACSQSLNEYRKLSLAPDAEMKGDFRFLLPVFQGVLDELSYNEDKDEDKKDRDDESLCEKFKDGLKSVAAQYLAKDPGESLEQRAPKILDDKSRVFEKDLQEAISQLGALQSKSKKEEYDLERSEFDKIASSFKFNDKGKAVKVGKDNFKSRLQGLLQCSSDLKMMGVENVEVVAARLSSVPRVKLVFPNLESAQIFCNAIGFLGEDKWKDSVRSETDKTHPGKTVVLLKDFSKNNKETFDKCKEFLGQCRLYVDRKAARDAQSMQSRVMKDIEGLQGNLEEVVARRKIMEDKKEKQEPSKLVSRDEEDQTRAAAEAQKIKDQHIKDQHIKDQEADQAKRDAEKQQNLKDKLEAEAGVKKTAEQIQKQVKRDEFRGSVIEGIRSLYDNIDFFERLGVKKVDGKQSESFGYCVEDSDIEADMQVATGSILITVNDASKLDLLKSTVVFDQAKGDRSLDVDGVVKLQVKLGDSPQEVKERVLFINGEVQKAVEQLEEEYQRAKIQAEQTNLEAEAQAKMAAEQDQKQWELEGQARRDAEARTLTMDELIGMSLNDVKQLNADQINRYEAGGVPLLFHAINNKDGDGSFLIGVDKIRALIEVDNVATDCLNWAGKTLLHDAIYCKRHDVVHCLLESGYRAEFKDRNYNFGKDGGQATILEYALLMSESVAPLIAFYNMAHSHNVQVPEGQDSADGSYIEFLILDDSPSHSGYKLRKIKADGSYKMYEEDRELNKFDLRGLHHRGYKHTPEAVRLKEGADPLPDESLHRFARQPASGRSFLDKVRMRTNVQPVEREDSDDAAWTSDDEKEDGGSTTVGAVDREVQIRGDRELAMKLAAHDMNRRYKEARKRVDRVDNLVAEDALLEEEERERTKRQKREGLARDRGMLENGDLFKKLLQDVSTGDVDPERLRDNEFLFYAIENNISSDRFKYLIDNCPGFDVNARDGSSADQPTLLHWAARFGRSDICASLLDKKCDSRATDGGGHTALYYASAVANGDSAAALIAFNNICNSINAKFNVIDNGDGTRDFNIVPDLHSPSYNEYALKQVFGGSFRMTLRGNDLSCDDLLELQEADYVPFFDRIGPHPAPVVFGPPPLIVPVIAPPPVVSVAEATTEEVKDEVLSSRPKDLNLKIIDNPYVIREVKKNTKKFIPDGPYKGIGVDFDFERKEGKVVSLKVKEIFSPEDKRFSGGDFAAGSKMTAIYDRGERKTISDIFSDLGEDGAKQYLAQLFHKEGKVEFEIDGKKISCQNSKDSVYVTNKCAAATGLLPKGVKGVRIDKISPENQKKLISNFIKDEKYNSGPGSKDYAGSSPMPLTVKKGIVSHHRTPSVVI